MTTQVQTTHAEQVFADIFNDGNLTKYNKIDDTKTSSETEMAINSFLDYLEEQYPQYIFVDSPNLERDKKIKIGILINAFKRTKTRAKNRKVLWNKGRMAVGFDTDFVFDFDRKLIID